MIVVINFILFSLSIFLCNISRDISNALIQKRKGLNQKPIPMFFNILPSYFSSLYIIVILFTAMYLTEIFMIPLIIVLLTKISLSEKPYTYWIIKLSGLLPLCVFFISAIYIDDVNVTSANPLMILSYTSAFIGVILFNYEPEENTALNISRNIALNFIILKSSYQNITFLNAIIFSCLVFYLQFIIIKIMPKFNLFEKARKVITLSIFMSFISFISVLLWDFYIRR
jgi:hypothetical protein